MNTVRARIWQFEIVPMSGGDPGVRAVHLGWMDLPVHLSRLVHINALACDDGRVVDYNVRAHEARLLTSYLAAPKGLALQVNYPSLLASSLHVRRLISECAGLGVMTAGSESLFSWEDGRSTLHSFDVLPPGPLKRKYGTLGVRPDLLFHLPNGQLVAGEARGRHRGSKTLFPKQQMPEQERRLLQLAAWSEGMDDHPYFMSWVYIGATGVGVDIFLPKASWWNGGIVKLGGPREQEVDWPMEPRRESRRQLDRLTENQMSVQRRRPRASVADVSRRTNERIEEVLGELYRTAPQKIGHFAEVPVKGAWFPADGLGVARHEVLIGVLAEYPPEQHRAHQHIGGTDLAGKQADVHLEGRLLAVVREIGATRPSMEQFEDVLLVE